MNVAFLQNGYTIIHSGREDGIHRQDVVLILSSEYVNGLLSCEVVSPRMVSVRAKTSTGVRNIIQVYADSSYLELYQYFLDMMQLKISAIQKGEELEVHGNDQHSSWTYIVGKF